MKSLTFDFTPDPRVLIALTQTPILPLDALCELIDNSIDSFTNSSLYGIKIDHPTIWIDLPKRSELDAGFGVVRIKDNGPGMTTEQAEKAIKAGYSGNNSIDTLGLFGMGFNISTGKIGIVTKFTTARKEDDYCTKTTIDLEQINETRDYRIQAEQNDKPLNFESGTQIEINRWWPEGHANHGFIYKLVGYGIKKIREEIGRRYATILREGNIQILVNKEQCIAYEHCVWDSKRYVMHQKIGKIQARYDINHVIKTHRRCAKCRSILSDNTTMCPSCGCNEIRSVEERIKGWVGIQRFDSDSNYGIDLIRNGRAIKIAEKRAFFEFVDEFQNVIKDYPIDSPYGRIIGEIHLDFVPVDFLKQDFQRSSEEWISAMMYLRGNSSLQPSKEGAEHNTSYIYKLFQGYRKVRTAGTTDMYMGYWDKAENRPKRISRDVERQYYEKFLAKEPGYFDDTEWWKLVEEASVPTVEPMVTCPECGAQNLTEAEMCSVCGRIFKGKMCANPECGKEIPFSATICPHCETSQVPVIAKPWTCEICGTKNSSGATICKKCHGDKGTSNPLCESEVLKHSVKDDDLSVENLTIKLANGQQSNPFNLSTYYSENTLVSPVTGESYPMIIFKQLGQVNIVIDKMHPLLVSCGTTPIEIISSEIASYVYDLYRNLSNNPGHSVSNIAWQLIRQYWLDRVELSEDTITQKAHNLLDSIKEQLINIVDERLSDRYFSEMTDIQQKLFVNELFKHHINMAKLNDLKTNGSFIRYVPYDFILHIFEDAPKMFFNGNYWTLQFGEKVDGISTMITAEIDERTAHIYRNALEAVIIYLTDKTKNITELKRIDAAINFLSENRSEEVL